MFQSIPIPVRPGKTRFPLALCAACGVSLTLVCLLHVGPVKPLPPATEFPRVLSPHAFITAQPEVGVMSEISAHGTELRAPTVPVVPHAGRRNGRGGSVTMVTPSPEADNGTLSQRPAVDHGSEPASAERNEAMEQLARNAQAALAPAGRHGTTLSKVLQAVKVHDVQLHLGRAFMPSGAVGVPAFHPAPGSERAAGALLEGARAGNLPPAALVRGRTQGHALEQRMGAGLGLADVMPESPPGFLEDSASTSPNFALEINNRLELTEGFSLTPYMRGQYFSLPSEAGSRAAAGGEVVFGQAGLRAGTSWDVGEKISLSLYGAAGLGFSVAGQGMERFGLTENGEARPDLSVGATLKRGDALSLNVLGGYSGGSNPGWNGVLALRYNF